MKLKLKPLADQVIVITGASSGIGLATAKMAAKAGACVVLAARNGEALTKICRDLPGNGEKSAWRAVDVADRAAVEALAGDALAKFGRIDTWVNCAGIDIWGKLAEVEEADSRKLFDTNFWGVVNGSLVAAGHMASGGALINVGSIAGDRAFPLQGMYSATKHAVRAFTEALRIELAADGIPVSVTLIKPSGIGTPLQGQARNYMEREPQLPGPLYAPESVAEAILHAAVTPARDINVGASGLAITTLGAWLPTISDWLGETRLIEAQKSQKPAGPPQDNLFHPGPGDGIVRDDPHSQGIRPSASLQVQLHPGLAAAGLFLALAVTAAALKPGRRSPAGH